MSKLSEKVYVECTSSVFDNIGTYKKMKRKFLRRLSSFMGTVSFFVEFFYLYFSYSYLE